MPGAIAVLHCQDDQLHLLELHATVILVISSRGHHEFSRLVLLLDYSASEEAVGLLRAQLASSSIF